MGYKVLAPCIVAKDGGKSATHYRTVGDVIEVERKADADALVAGGFLEAVADAKTPEPQADPAKAKPGA